MALSVIDIYKLLPRRDCRDCGYMTCLAFATAVIKEGIPMDGCSHLTEAADTLAPGLKTQQKAGIGRRRAPIDNAIAAMREKVAPLDFCALAPGLAATFGREGENAFLELHYFGLLYRILKDRLDYPSGADDDPWDTVLLYNFIYSQGKGEPAGKWISMKDLPNSVSKAADINELQKEMAAWADGHFEELLVNAERTGGRPATLETKADAALLFQPFAKVPILLVFYKSDSTEGFRADAQFLYDATIVNWLDMESIVFLTEKLVKKLTARESPLVKKLR